MYGVFHSDPSRMPAVRFLRNGKISGTALYNTYITYNMCKL